MTQNSSRSGKLVEKQSGRGFETNPQIWPHAFGVTYLCLPLLTLLNVWSKKARHGTGSSCVGVVSTPLQSGTLNITLRGTKAQPETTRRPQTARISNGTEPDKCGCLRLASYRLTHLCCCHLNVFLDAKKITAS